MIAPVLLGLAGAAALVDWIAVARARKPLEYVAKPAVMVLLAVAALTVGPAYAQRRWWFVAALLLSLAGDVFLMLRHERFVAGLAAFLLAHVAYISGFVAEAAPGGVHPLAAVAAVTVVAATIGVRIVAAAPSRLRGPVVAYLLAICVMAALALVRGPAVAAAGAVLFLASDSLLGWERFVGAGRWMRLGVIVTYHLAQVALVVSLW